MTFKDLPGAYPGILIFPQYQNEDVLLKKLTEFKVTVDYDMKLLGLEKHPEFVTAQIQNGKSSLPFSYVFTLGLTQ